MGLQTKSTVLFSFICIISVIECSTNVEQSMTTLNSFQQQRYRNIISTIGPLPSTTGTRFSTMDTQLSSKKSHLLTKRKQTTISEKQLITKGVQRSAIEEQLSTTRAQSSISRAQSSTTGAKSSITRTQSSTTGAQSTLMFGKLPEPEFFQGEKISTMKTSKIKILASNKLSEDEQALINCTNYNQESFKNILVLKKIACNKTMLNPTPDSKACYYFTQPTEESWKFQCQKEVDLGSCNLNISVNEDTQNNSRCSQPRTNTTSKINKCMDILRMDNCSIPIDYLTVLVIDANTKQSNICDDCDMWFVKSLLAESITFGFIGIIFVNNFIWVWCWTKRNRQEKLTIQPKSYKQEDFEIIYAWQNSHDNAVLAPTPKAKRPRRIREVPLYENISIHEIVSTV